MNLHHKNLSDVGTWDHCPIIYKWVYSQSMIGFHIIVSVKCVNRIEMFVINILHLVVSLHNYM